MSTVAMETVEITDLYRKHTDDEARKHTDDEATGQGLEGSRKSSPLVHQGQMCSLRESPRSSSSSFSSQKRR